MWHSNCLLGLRSRLLHLQNFNYAGLYHRFRRKVVLLRRGHKRRVATLRGKTDSYKIQMETENFWVSAEMDVGEFRVSFLVS